jgi:hypothetical protein
MSYSTLIRMCGLVVILTGAAVILFNAVLWTGVIPRTWEYPGYLFLQTLLLFSLFAIFTRHVERSSALLLAGLFLTAIDLVFGVGFSYYASFAFPILKAQFPDAVRAVLSGPVGTISMLSMGLGLLGNILFYIAVLRARILPRWPAVVVIVSQVLGLAMLPYNIPVMVAAVGMIGIGFAMYTGSVTRGAALQPQPAA